MNRREFLQSVPIASLSLASLGGCSAFGSRRQIGSVDVQVLWNGRNGDAVWFHPRPCIVPGGVLMTMQSISGSDYFGHVHWTRTEDNGQTWSEPVKIEAFGRNDVGGGYSEGVCDVVPQFHPKTGVVLAVGHNVYHSKGRLARPQRERFPVFVTGDGKGQWSKRRRVEWDHPDADRIYTCGCAERLVLDDGDVLIPISFGDKKRQDRAVTSMRCSFDGENLRVKELGSNLRLPVRRGLLEPSLTVFEDLFHMTIRAEDGRGYNSTSRDGLTWSPIRPWHFDDGEELVMSTTQQHWLATDAGLFLVYTRRDTTNTNVMRYRAPLYIAAVDPEAMTLIRDSERVVFPLRGDPKKAPKDVARMGNFHTLVVTRNEAWITVGEARPTAQWRGDLLLARIRWTLAQNSGDQDRLAAAYMSRHEDVGPCRPG